MVEGIGAKIAAHAGVDLRRLNVPGPPKSAACAKRQLAVTFVKLRISLKYPNELIQMPLGY